MSNNTLGDLKLVNNGKQLSIVGRDLTEIPDVLQMKFSNVEAIDLSFNKISYFFYF